MLNEHKTMKRKNDFTLPERAVEQVRPREEYGAGVVADTLSDACNDALAADRMLSDCYVYLDNVCDDLGLLPNDVHDELRQQQRQIQQLQQWMDEYRECLREAAEEAREKEREEIDRD